MKLTGQDVELLGRIAMTHPQFVEFLRIKLLDEDTRLRGLIEPHEFYRAQGRAGFALDLLKAVSK